MNHPPILWKFWFQGNSRFLGHPGYVINHYGTMPKYDGSGDNDEEVLKKVTKIFSNLENNNKGSG